MRNGWPGLTSIAAGSLCLVFNANGEFETRANRIVAEAFGPPAVADTHPNSIRIATFNAKFLPFVPSNKTRAHILADRISESGYDVVALNEVFSENARRILVNGLKTTYPYMVTYIGSRRYREDSGLMLFSRFPFGDPLTSNHDSIGFAEFTACKSSDCLAGKGVAYAPLWVNGVPIRVFSPTCRPRTPITRPRTRKKSNASVPVRSAKCPNLSHGS